MSQPDPTVVGVPFECELHLRWSDQDANGHVNNARVITLLEEARITAYLTWIGTTPDGERPRVVRSLQAEYHRAMHYGHPLSAKVWISRIGSSSFTVHHELHQQGQLCVSGDTGIVQLTADHSRSDPLHDNLRQALSRALIPAEPPSS
ncbi:MULTISPECIES: acyl-CoA thioesterase [Micrococcales]|jgi:acyl-CoA thioester hydrolase|uniref:Thioesterase superfamily n=1 Tax=Brevibacterium sp. Ap13 TaxID=1406197 RepID=U5NZQ1_9MICO|nr:thioesterase family protein [Brevibacterium sp. Ap13]AGY35400.1 thioesterase superfamily [Brevibacterium sp. Ap13]